VNSDSAERILGNARFRKAGEIAQRKSVVLLKNSEVSGRNVLPLKGKPKIYIEGIDPEVANQYGNVVKNTEDADVAILHLSTPFAPKEKLFDRMHHSGDLNFKGKEKERILSVMERLPTIVDIYMDRPAVIPKIAEKSVGLLANFGVNDDAVLDVIFGHFTPGGKLPIEMPSSMEAVRQQKADIPYDSENPLFPFGHGLTY